MVICLKHYYTILNVTVRSMAKMQLCLMSMLRCWLSSRTAADDTAFLMHIPSTPIGWSAGKLGDWYPDVRQSDGSLGTEIEKTILACRLVESTSASHGNVEFSKKIGRLSLLLAIYMLLPLVKSLKVVRLICKIIQ